MHLARAFRGCLFADGELTFALPSESALVPVNLHGLLLFRLPPLPKLMAPRPEAA